MKRGEVLDTAKGYVTVDRQADHGAPEDTFGLIAKFWSVYLDDEISPTQVAMMMALLKVARQRANPYHDDNYVDGAGYLACAGELAESMPMRDLPRKAQTHADEVLTVDLAPGEGLNVPWEPDDHPITKEMIDRQYGEVPKGVHVTIPAGSLNLPTPPGYTGQGVQPPSAAGAPSEKPDGSR